MNADKIQTKVRVLKGTQHQRQPGDNPLAPIGKMIAGGAIVATVLASALIAATCQSCRIATAGYHPSSNPSPPAILSSISPPLLSQHLPELNRCDVALKEVECPPGAERGKHYRECPR
jgi:hypothetical protein